MVDASLYGVGGVLSQRCERDEWNVCFASRTLNDIERRFAVIEKELLACVWAIEHFRNYIWSSKFVLRTDHKPLVSILSPGGGWNSTARIARLTSRLQEYCFKPEFVPGRKSVVTDFMSRLPCQNTSDASLDDSEVVTTIQDVVCGTFESISEDSWKSAEAQDVTWQTIKNYVLQG